MEKNRIIQGDALTELRKLPDQSINCWITSPPYWGLRNYGVDGQMGMEKTPEAFILNMVEVFREARRVLTDDGTLWLNMGDTYMGGKGSNGASEAYRKRNPGKKVLNEKALINTSPGDIRPNDRPHPLLKAKDMVGIPWRLAFALQQDGWYLRQDIIWHKPNPMPESTQDRCTKAHEYIFLLSKSRKYYFDALSIATPYADKTFTTFGIESKGNGDGSGLIQSENWANDVPVRQPKKWKVPDGWDTEKGGHNGPHRQERSNGKINENAEVSGFANKRSVWTVATEPYKDAHYATFPRRLITDCVKAGCPVGGMVGDMFGGTGTTGEVAHGLGRYFTLIELNPKSIKLIYKRLQKGGTMFL